MTVRIVVSDSSCLIDLQKGKLLRAIFELPYTFVIPQPLFDHELQSLSRSEKEALVAAGMEVLNLPGEQVSMAMKYSNENPKLSIYDCFAYVLAKENEDAVLFTGDANLRSLADSNGLETHGIIWAIDELEVHTDTPAWLLVEALQVFSDDPMVWLPDDELQKRIKKLKKL